MSGQYYVPMPDLDLMLQEANAILEEADWPRCHSITPVADGDTANPNVIGYAETRKYVIKATFRHPDTLAQQLHTANWFQEHRALPIPRHLGHATSPHQLPLMVMEWLPGDQLRLALGALDRENASVMAQDWGRCLARMHTSQVPEGLIQSSPESEMSYWSNPERYETAFDQVDALDDFWTSNLRDHIKQFLKERGDSLDGIRPGIRKADSDTRDFLVGLEPKAHISGMLDWERVNYGYVLYDCLVAYIRLVIADREALWPYFCEGYETETGLPLLQAPDVEYVLMVRGLTPALRGLPRAKKIILSLVEGQKVPFQKRD